MGAQAPKEALTPARVMAAEVGAKAGVDPATIVTVLSLLLQAWAACRDVDPTPAGLRVFAKNQRGLFRGRVRWQARRAGVPRSQRAGLADEIERRLLTDRDETIAAVFADVERGAS
jgi:hypothetical protein